MRGRIRLASFILYSLTIITVVVTVFSFVRALYWINKPFPGFLMYHPSYVGSFSSRDWPGKQAGLRYLDRIIAVDGQPVNFGEDVIDNATRKAPGTKIKYTIESNGKIRTVSIPVDIFDLKDFLIIFFLPFFVGVIVYVLGFIVSILKPNTSTSWVFLFLCFGVCLYGVTGFEIQSSYMLTRFHFFILFIYPSCFFHLGLIFPERKQILMRFPMFEYVVYIPAVIGAILFQIYFSTFPEIIRPHTASLIPTYVELSSFARIYTLFCVASLVIFVLHATFRASDVMARQRARMILFGVTMAFLPPGVLMMIALFMKVYFPFNFIAFFTIFFPLSIAYSIVRHNLFDSNDLVRRAVGYFVVTTVIIGAYMGVSILLNIFMEKYKLAQSRAFPILFTLGVILVFNPLRDRIQSLVDRVFFRKDYNYGEIIEKVGTAMTSMLDMRQILDRLTQTFIYDMYIDTSSVMLLSAEGSEYRVRVADGEKKQDIDDIVLRREEPLAHIVEESKRELTRYDVIEDPKYRMVSKSCIANFDKLHANLMVPLVYQNQVIGLMTLGEKKSGKPYNREDIDLLHALANQSAVAIENARLFHENLEKQRMEEELSIARELQMSMLPSASPHINGFEIASFSVPAREVGGDFYDFVEIDANRIGMIVGDVTGKSVSGALVMAASRSIFRMLSEEELDVGNIMVRANRRAKKDISGNIFVALLYSVLDADEKTLGLCSAGQTQPIYFSGERREARLVETKGDTFPLGILEDVNYEETKLQLFPGDKVIFYTDGIVEAMNEKEEMFGFDRLLEVVKVAQSDSADALLHKILTSVNEFVGGIDQHDDLTIIVINVKNETHSVRH